MCNGLENKEHIEVNVTEILEKVRLIRGKDCSNCGHKRYILAKNQRLFTLGWLSLIFVLFIIFRIKLSNQDEPLL